MSLHDPLPPDHYIQHFWNARCSCGWRSHDLVGEAQATEALKNHNEHIEFKARLQEETSA